MIHLTKKVTWEFDLSCVCVVQNYSSADFRFTFLEDLLCDWLRLNGLFCDQLRLNDQCKLVL